MQSKVLGQALSHFCRASTSLSKNSARYSTRALTERSPQRTPSLAATAARQAQLASAAHFSTAAPESAAVNNSKNQPAPVRDFFLDNLGKIFLAAIGLLIGSLVRSSYGTSNMKKVKEELEDDSALDPLEIDELRKANSELSPELFRNIMRDVKDRGQMTYLEFVEAVRSTMVRIKGEGATIGMGHLLDRVVIKTFEEQAHSSSTGDTMQDYNSSVSDEWNEDGVDSMTMSVSFWLTVLSLALHGPVPDRIRLLYEILELGNYNAHESNSGEHSENVKVTIDDVTDMVGHLQRTCQLVPEKQVRPVLHDIFSSYNHTVSSHYLVFQSFSMIGHSDRD